jgi:hypothetical protein
LKNNATLVKREGGIFEVYLDMMLVIMSRESIRGLGMPDDILNKNSIWYSKPNLFAIGYKVALCVKKIVN